MTIIFRVCAGVCLCGLISAIHIPGRAVASDEARMGLGSESPWAVQVSADARVRAQALYDEGNEHIIEARVADAIASYRQALRLWDHPLIHLNLAVAQEYLGQLVPARQSLEKALRYDDHQPPPLLPAEKRRAEVLREKIDERIVEVKIYCTEAMAAVYLNDEQVFIGPGGARQWVLPGGNQIAAQKPGYMENRQWLDLSAGQTVVVHLHLIPLDEAEGKRRWARWKPWAVLGTGVALGIAGGAWHWGARRDDQVARDIHAQCERPGCRKDEKREIGTLERRAEVRRRSAVVAGVAGTASLMSGLALLYANRPRPHKPVSVQISASRSSGAIGLGIAGTF